MSEVIYELKEPFDYSRKGEVENATFITLFAPTFKTMEHMVPIKQAFTAAITEVTESVAQSSNDTGDDEQADDLTGHAALQVLWRWSGDLNKVFLHARELFKSGAALVDGEERLTTPLLEKMSLRDFEALVGEYLANFIVPSLMDGQ